MSALFKRVAFHWKRCWVCPTLYNMFVGGKSRTGEPSERRIELDALLPEYAARPRQKGVTVRKLFEEYSHGHPEGYRHANFGILLQRYMLQQRPLDMWNIMRATRCTSPSQGTGLR